MTSDGKPSAAPVSGHGIEPMPPSDGPEPTPSAYLEILANCQKQITLLLEMVMGLASRVEALEGMVDEGDEGQGTDMAGNRIQVS